MQPTTEAFFDPTTFTYSYVVTDPDSSRCAIIDPVLDYDPAGSRTSTNSAQRIVDFVTSRSLQLDWILETHVHADHLSAASYVKQQLGGRTGIGRRVVEVQETFADFFDTEATFTRDGSQFDHLFDDDEHFAIGTMDARVLFTPGHTPGCVTYLVGTAAFVGDTLFMPDYGTARTDFPGGDAAILYRSIQRILALPADTALYMCHDYGTDTRSDFQCVSSVAEELSDNVHIGNGTGEADFVALRQARDAELAPPRLLLPSVQFNMRGARLPPAEDNGSHYFKIPVRTA